MVSGQFRANVDQVFRGNAELGHGPLRLDLCNSKVAAQCLRRILYFTGTRTELQCSVTIFFVSPVGYHLAIFQPQNGDRNMLACIVIDAGHAHFLSDHSRTHGCVPFDPA